MIIENDCVTADHPKRRAEKKAKNGKGGSLDLNSLLKENKTKGYSFSRKNNKRKTKTRRKRNNKSKKTRKLNVR